VQYLSHPRPIRKASSDQNDLRELVRIRRLRSQPPDLVPYLGPHEVPSMIRHHLDHRRRPFLDPLRRVWDGREVASGRRLIREGGG
jgi:hypothetical protein